MADESTNSGQIKLNKPLYLVFIAAVLSECQLYLTVEPCSSPADNVWTLAAVTSKCPLSEIVGHHVADTSSSNIIGK